MDPAAYAALIAVSLVALIVLLFAIEAPLWLCLLCGFCLSRFVTAVRRA